MIMKDLKMLNINKNGKRKCFPFIYSPVSDFSVDMITTCPS